MIVPQSVLNDLGVTAQVACDFFTAFSRFEYALKAAGYGRPGSYGSADPDWGRWSSDVGRQQNFANMVRNPQSPLEHDVYNAYHYLTNDPPKRQKWDPANNCPSWENPSPLPVGSELKQMVEALKRIRNNLFHGGKYATQDTTQEVAADRNREMVQYGLILLQALLTLDNNLDTVFRS